MKFVVNSVLAIGLRGQGRLFGWRMRAEIGLII
jgi:hypothetical protein